MSAGVTRPMFLNPNPQALMSGAQVMSNMPSVCRDTSSATRKAWMKMESTSTSRFMLTALTMDSESKGLSEW